MAAGDRDGRGDQTSGGCNVVLARDPRMTPVPQARQVSREGQTFAGASLLVRYINFVKLPHTLFALPFALLGVLAASQVVSVRLQTVLLVVIAFSAARWVAMGFNRIV